jgi:hypothetical protein
MACIISEATYLEDGQNLEGSAAMQRRRRFDQIQSLEERLAEEAKRLQVEAQKLPRGPLRDVLMRRARQAETGSHMSEWLRSPGLRTPR